MNPSINLGLRLGNLLLVRSIVYGGKGNNKTVAKINRLAVMSRSRLITGDFSMSASQAHSSVMSPSATCWDDRPARRVAIPCRPEYPFSTALTSVRWAFSSATTTSRTPFLAEQPDLGFNGADRADTPLGLPIQRGSHHHPGWQRYQFPRSPLRPLREELRKDAEATGFAGQKTIGESHVPSMTIGSTHRLQNRLELQAVESPFADERDSNMVHRVMESAVKKLLWIDVGLSHPLLLQFEINQERRTKVCGTFVVKC